MAETPEVTPANEWTVPNQDKLEQVIDSRLERNGESESSETSSETSPNDDDKVEDEAPKTTEVTPEAPKAS